MLRHQMIKDAHVKKCEFFLGSGGDGHVIPAWLRASARMVVRKYNCRFVVSNHSPNHFPVDRYSFRRSIVPRNMGSMAMSFVLHSRPARKIAVLLFGVAYPLSCLFGYYKSTRYVFLRPHIPDFVIVKIVKKEF